MRNERLGARVKDTRGRPTIPAENKYALDEWRAQEREDRAEPPRISYLAKLRLMSALAHVAARRQGKRRSPEGVMSKRQSQFALRAAIRKRRSRGRVT